MDTTTPTKRKIIIVGGGIIGVSSAYYLTQSAKYDQETTEIVIVEGSGIASGASGKAGGLLALDWHGEATKSLAALSYNLHASLAKQYDGASNWGYRQLDTLSLSVDLTSNHRTNLKKHNSIVVEGFEWLNKEILTETSIIGTKSTTAQAHPRLLSEFLMKLAADKGVKTEFGTVDAIERVGEKEGKFKLSITSKDTDRKSEIHATDVLIAAGPWSGNLVKKIKGKLGGRGRDITGSRAHSVVIKTAVTRLLPAQALFTSIKTKTDQFLDTEDPEIYNRPDGTSYACGPVDNSTLPSRASEVTVDPSATALIIKQVASLSDYLKVGDEKNEASVVAEQACYLPTGDRPVIAEIAPSLYFASGHSCWGIQNGPGTGLVISELIMDGIVTSADISFLGP